MWEVERDSGLLTIGEESREDMMIGGEMIGGGGRPTDTREVRGDRQITLQNPIDTNVSALSERKTTVKVEKS